MFPLKSTLRTTLFSVLISMSIVLSIMPTSVSAQSPLARFFTIQSVSSGKCLVATNEGIVTQSGCHGTDELPIQQFLQELWRFIPVGDTSRGSSNWYQYDGVYQIVSASSGKCLDVAGAILQQFDCHGGPNQVFKIAVGQYGAMEDYMQVISLNSQKCLDVAGASKEDGAVIQQFDCHGGDNQIFAVRGMKAPSCGGVISYGQTLQQENLEDWPHCDLWFQGKVGDWVSVDVTVLSGSGNLAPTIILFDGDARLITQSGYYRNLIYQLNSGNGWYGFRITSAVEPRTYGTFRVSLNLNNSTKILPPVNALGAGVGTAGGTNVSVNSKDTPRMATVPLVINPGSFYSTYQWESTPSKSFDGKTVTLTTSGSSPGILVQKGDAHVFHPQGLNRKLLYGVLGDKFLLILDMEKGMGASQRWVSLINFDTMTEVPVLDVLARSDAVPPPVISQSAESGTAFLAYGQDGTFDTSVGIYRSDNAGVLCSLGFSIIPTGALTGEATATDLIIHYSTNNQYSAKKCPR